MTVTPENSLELIEQHLVSTLLSEEANKQFALGDIGTKELLPFVESLKAISSAYVSHESGAKLSSPIDSAKAAKAYALYYTPINAAKVLHLLKQIKVESSELRVLDLGCGPGTAGLALLASLNCSIKLTCVESSREMRNVAKELLTNFKGVGSLSQLRILETISDLGADEKFDLIIAANVLAEMSDDLALKAVEKLAKSTAPGGHLILLEPGQLHHTRRLMGLRDLVTTEHKDLVPLFPCLRSDKCPMLSASPSDWCHGVIEWRQPRLNARLDDLLEFNKHRIKFSGFIFKSGGALLEGIRVITPPRKTRAGIEALVCSKDLYGIARISKKDRSKVPDIKAFEKAKVFQRLELGLGLAHLPSSSRSH
jgi:SAM-dependent methyltransferase